MKKVLFTILLMLSMVIMPEVVDAKNEVTIYLFRGSTCGHCEEAIKYINEHKDELNGINFVTYEVFDHAANSELHDIIQDKLNVSKDYQNKVPLFVIGEKYVPGYSSITTFNKIMEIAEDYLDDENYKDVVEESVKELNKEVKPMTLTELFPEPNKVVTIIVYSIFGLIVLGFAGMIIFSRK